MAIAAIAIHRIARAIGNQFFLRLMAVSFCVPYPRSLRIRSDRISKLVSEGCGDRFAQESDDLRQHAQRPHLGSQRAGWKPSVENRSSRAGGVSRLQANRSASVRSWRAAVAAEVFVEPFDAPIGSGARVAYIGKETGEFPLRC